MEEKGKCRKEELREREKWKKERGMILRNGKKRGTAEKEGSG